MGDRDLDGLRRHGFGVADRMLGSVSEAEDVVQEALVRLTRQEDHIDVPAAWMTTVVTRLSINVHRSARARRESYVGPWLPEPLLEEPTLGAASRAEQADSLSMALLVLLERLTPVERAAGRPVTTQRWSSCVRVEHDAHGLDPALDDIHREHAPDPDISPLRGHGPSRVATGRVSGVLREGGELLCVGLARPQERQSLLDRKPLGLPERPLRRPS
jgi:Sigma-70 region 2